MNFLLNVTWLSDSVFTHARHFRRFSLFRFDLPRDQVILMTWSRGLWKPFLGFQPVTRSKKGILKTGNGLMMNKDVTPERTISDESLCYRICGAFAIWEQGYQFSSKSNLEAPRHHQNLRGKQLENLTRQPGSSREPKVPRPFGKYSRHHCFTKNVCAITFTQSSIVPFPIV